MLIVRVIGSDSEKPVTREIVQICAPEDTVESLKDDIAHVTGVDSADQKLYKNSSNGKDVEEVSSHDDEKSLVEAGLMVAEDSSSSSSQKNNNKKNDFEFVFLMTPESSYEMLRAVSSSGNDDEAADNHSASASKKNEKGDQDTNEHKQNEADRPTDAKDDDDD